MSPYSPRQKAKALRLYAEVGPRQASRELKIPEATVRKWAKAKGLKPPTENITAGVKAQEARIAAKRAKLKERLLDEALYCTAAIHREHIDFKGVNVKKVRFPVAPAAAVQNYATSIGILIDKFRLENGEVTGRDEVITIDAIDRAIQELEAEVGRREPANAGAQEPA